MKKNKYRKIIAALIVPTLLIFAIEYTLRMLDVEINTGKGGRDSLFYFEIASKKSPKDRDIYLETGPQIHTLDSRAYKCKYQTFDKKNNEYIILAIGDSCTYGLGSKKSYPYYLENILNNLKTTNINYKVYNFGFPGYSSYQGLLFLKKYLNHLKPDYIIAWFGANDAIFAPFYSDKEFDYTGKSRSKLIKIHKKLYKKFKLYRLLKNINTNYVRKIVSKSFDNPNNKKYRKFRVSTDEFTYNLREIENMAKLNNSYITFIWHCWLIDEALLKEDRYQPPANYLDLCNLYRESKEQFKFLYADHCHPSDLGHKIIAEELAKIILGMIENNDIK